MLTVTLYLILVLADGSPLPSIHDATFSDVNACKQQALKTGDRLIKKHQLRTVLYLCYPTMEV